MGVYDIDRRILERYMDMVQDHESREFRKRPIDRTYLHMGSRRYDPELLRREQARGIGYHIGNQPRRALWGATYTPDNDYISSWARLNHGVYTGLTPYSQRRAGLGFTYRLKDDARLLPINGLKDYMKTVDQYPEDRVRGNLFDRARRIDYDALSKDYDAMYISPEGAAQLTGRYNETDPNAALMSVTNEYQNRTGVPFESIYPRRSDDFDKLLKQGMVGEKGRATAKTVWDEPYAYPSVPTESLITFNPDSIKDVKEHDDL